MSSTVAVPHPPPNPDPTSAETADAKRKRKREKEKANKLLKKPKPDTDDSTSQSKSKSKSKSKNGTAGGKGKAAVKELAPAKPLTEADENVNEDIAHMDPKLIADYVASRTRKLMKDLSTVELQDMFISERAFMDTTSFLHPRKLEQLPDYLETFSKNSHDVSKASTARGTPHTLIVSAAALRATHLARAVKKFQSKDAMVAKLFAKHIKLSESIEFCRSTRIGIGVGTPGRILDLIKEDVLHIEELKQIVVDASHVDKKNYGIFDIRETQKALLDFLNFSEVRRRLDDGSTKILFY
ncbi:Protein cms1 [Rhizina undulata]